MSMLFERANRYNYIQQLVRLQNLDTIFQINYLVEIETSKLHNSVCTTYGSFNLLIKWERAAMKQGIDGKTIPVYHWDEVILPWPGHNALINHGFLHSLRLVDRNMEKSSHRIIGMEVILTGLAGSQYTYQPRRPSFVAIGRSKHGKLVPPHHGNESDLLDRL